MVEAIDCGNSPVLPSITVDPTATPSNEIRTITLENLTAGEYCFLVYDGFGCSEFVNSFTINAPAELTSSVVATTNASCYTESLDATLTVEASGGMPPYTYYGESETLVSSGPVTFTNLGSGDQIISIVDNLGCTTGIADSIGYNAIVAAASTYENNQGCSGVDFRQDVTLAGVGGQAPYTFEWEDGSIESFRAELAAGDYHVTVQDANGCSKDFFVNVDEPLELSLEVVSTGNNLCPGETNGSVDLAGMDGLEGFLYSLNNIDYQASSTFSDLATGNYTPMSKMQRLV